MMKEQKQRLKIHENNQDHFPDFLRLNRQWIEKFFEMEACDWQLEEKIVERSQAGDLFFTVTIETESKCEHNFDPDGQQSAEPLPGTQNQSMEKVVGACALFAANQDGRVQFELARMAVDPNFHGNGIGRLLMNHALEKAKDLQADRLFLMTNTVLNVAVEMYRKWGFRDCLVGPHPDYGRCNLVMEKWLQDDA